MGEKERAGGVLFSIVVVALNPDDKWKGTLNSIFAQTCGSFEVIYKDGLSKDGSAQAVLKAYGQDPRLRMFREADKSIYDAMNQAVGRVTGDYVLFLNCGDRFYDERVLERTQGVIRETGNPGKCSVTGKKEELGKSGDPGKSRNPEKSGDPGKSGEPGKGREPGKCGVLSESAEAGKSADDGRNSPTVFYGNTYSEAAGAMVHSAPAITGFTCFRNIPCHQSCFYAIRLLREKSYDLSYRIRADYDHFLWCFYQARARMVFLDFTVASYEGGGYSESRENKARDREEHRLITKTYMGKGERLGYQLLLAVTLAPLRRFMAENKAFSGIYHKLKSWIYRKKAV